MTWTRTSGTLMALLLVATLFTELAVHEFAWVALYAPRNLIDVSIGGPREVIEALLESLCCGSGRSMPDFEARSAEFGY